MKTIKFPIFLFILFIGCDKDDVKSVQFSEGVYSVQENIVSNIETNVYPSTIYDIEVINKIETSCSFLNFPGAQNDTVFVDIKADSIFIPSQKFYSIVNDTIYISGKGIISDINKLKYTYRSGSKLGVFTCTCVATKK